MSEESVVESPESLIQPVEIKFGNIVNLAGEDPATSFVVIKPHGTRKIEVSEVTSEEEGKESLNPLGSTRSQHAQVIGNWPLEKVIGAFLRGSGSPDGSVPAALREIAIKHLTSYSQMPSVMYAGKTDAERAAELADRN